MKASNLLPSTDKGKAVMVGLLLIFIGLSIGLPPVALWGPGAGLVVPGALITFLGLAAPPPESDA